MTDTNKDTIYVDIDDEITALIDKVRASNAKLIALVLPKRATVLQSIVNMKLLKRTADNEKKNLVLITNESGLMPLAGAVGLYVAQSLSSKPEVPPMPSMGGSVTETVDEDLSIPIGGDEEELPDLTKRTGKSASIGSLTDAAKHVDTQTKADHAMDTIQLDDEEPEINSTDSEALPLEGKPIDSAPKKAAKKNKIKIPNFDRFRTLIILGALLLIGLIVLAIFAFVVWPHAYVDIKTNASNVNTNINLTLDTNAQSVSHSNGIVPAQVVTEQKTYSQTVNTTGQKNEGTVATGSVNMVATVCNSTNPFQTPSDVPAGTGISANNLTYITQADTSFSLVNAYSKGSCDYYPASSATAISAQSAGSNYNVNNTSFTVAGRSDVTANGSASGGTDNVVQVVTQTDVSNATSKINANNSGAVEQTLSNELKGQGEYPINATFTSGTPQISSSPSIGSQSNTVTVTETVTYTMFGAKMSDLKSIVNANVQSQTGKSQNIISDGINQSAFKQDSGNNTRDHVTLTTLAEVGPNLSTKQIKKQVVGKSPQQIISLLKQNPDVTNVTVRLSPFWVSSAPNNGSKITVKIAKPSNSTK